VATRPLAACARGCRYRCRGGISIALCSLVRFALRRPDEVLRRAGEGFDVSLGPLVGRLEDDRISLATDEDGIALEPKLFRQSDSLAATSPEHLGALRFRLRHDMYQ